MLDPKTLLRCIILLCALCVPPHSGASKTVVSADMQTESGSTGVDQTETIKRLKEENAKLKFALSDAEVENANLRDAIKVHENRDKRDRESSRKVLLVLTIAAAIILLIRFTAPRLRRN